MRPATPSKPGAKPGPRSLARHQARRLPARLRWNPTHHRLVCGLEDAGWIIRDKLDWIYASGFPKGKANLKPAHEPIVLARKPGPLRPLAIDECRIPANGRPLVIGHDGSETQTLYEGGFGGSHAAGITDGAARPSNVLLSDPELFDQPNPYVVGSGATTTDGVATMHDKGGTWFGTGTPKGTQPDMGYGGGGGYSRFFAIR